MLPFFYSLSLLLSISRHLLTLHEAVSRLYLFLTAQMLHLLIGVSKAISLSLRYSESLIISAILPSVHCSLLELNNSSSVMAKVSNTSASAISYSARFIFILSVVRFAIMVNTFQTHNHKPFNRFANQMDASITAQTMA